MSNQDRETFEADCQRREVYAGRHHEYPEQYQLFETQLRWMGWQACAAYYAPKLTAGEDAFVGKENEAAAITLFAETLRGNTLPGYWWDLMGPKKRNAWRDKAQSAAGVKFKDEA